MTTADDRWADATAAAALLAIDPGLGGAVVRSAAGPVLDRWLALYRQLAPMRPLRRLPGTLDVSRLSGGLDLAATLNAGRRIDTPGLLDGAEAILVPMAERLDSGAAALIGQALDRGTLVVALDEGEADEAAPAGLTDRLAFAVDLAGLRASLETELPDVHTVTEGRAVLPRVTATAPVLEALVEAAAALGIASLRAPLFALRAARAAAALAGRVTVTDEDAALAARLVLAPRATQLPERPEQEQTPDDRAPPPRGESGDTEALGDMLVEAARAALPPGLIEAMARGTAPRAKAGRSGAMSRGASRGVRIGTRPGRPEGNARLDILDTLRAAAPWQPLRRRSGERLQVRPSDFRIRRYKRRSETALIVLLDASGSSALARLAEAKGAIELMLTSAYSRRDQVALIAFRGDGAELLLAPTRAPARARRQLAGLPGGGGTPLASGLAAALVLADQIVRRGIDPRLVLLTDGAANVALDGSKGREAAMADALRIGRQIGVAGHVSLVIDTATRPQQTATALAAAMGARYLPMPFADARALSRAARA